VHPRPEFWRPEQRRPRALLSVPIGNGVACIARRSRFTRKEVEAVRTVLRFLQARLEDTSRAQRSSRPVPRRKPSPAFAGEGLIGRSRAWRALLDQVARVAPADCSIVLQGETGTGKERLARAIHAASPRSQGPFIAVNCGAVAPDLMASELFGHIRGAFTGADRNRVGLVARAHGGTLFLDELVEMPPAMQVALLRVIEERQVTAVGSTRPRRVNIRILSATHADLGRSVEHGEFREDLYHRLCVFTLQLPPLRERDADLALLSHHLLGKLDPPRSLCPEAAAALLTYSWPGNVRELDNVLRAAALLSDDLQITGGILEDLLAQRRQQRRPRTSPAANREIGARSQSILQLLGQRWLGAPELAKEIGVSIRTVNRELDHLKRRGLVEHQGRARARLYRRLP
jgi:DNA-binding NtrC family response regulator